MGVTVAFEFVPLAAANSLLTVVRRASDMLSVVGNPGHRGGNHPLPNGESSMSLARTHHAHRDNVPLRSRRRRLGSRHKNFAGSAACMIALLAASILLSTPRPGPPERSAGVALAADNRTTTVLTCEPLLIGLGAFAAATMNTTLSGFAPAHGLSLIHI